MTREPGLPRRPDDDTPPRPEAAETGTSVSPYLLLAIPPLCWAGNFVIGRAMHAEITPAELTFWRWVVAGAVLLPLSARAAWRARSAVLAAWRLIAILALTGVVGFQYAVYRGLETTTAINAALIIAVVPAVIPLFAFLIDGTRIGARQALGIAVSMAGVAVIVLKGDPVRALGLARTPGDLWIALAVPLWSLYSVVVRRRPADLPPVVLLLASIIAGLVLLAPLYGWERARAGPTPLTLEILLTVGYVGVFASVIAFLTWNRGVQQVGASVAGLYMHLMPVFAALLAILFLGERPAPYHGVGIALIGLGLILSSTAGRTTLKPR